MKQTRFDDIAGNGRSRRRFLIGSAFAAATFAGGRAFASPAPAFPLHIAVARMGESGLVRVPTEHQRLWSAFSTRLGGLVEEMAPVQPASLIDLASPEEDGGAASAALARGFADRLGCRHVIIYATTDGIRRGARGGPWLNDAFRRLRETVQINDRAIAEAYLLDAAGGSPLASASADADRATPLDTLTGRHNEIDALKLLTADLERRVQRLAAAQLAANASIAD